MAAAVVAAHQAATCPLTSIVAATVAEAVAAAVGDSLDGGKPQRRPTKDPRIQMLASELLQTPSLFEV